MDQVIDYDDVIHHTLQELVITKGYGVLATTIEGQNAFAPKLCFA